MTLNTEKPESGRSQTPSPRYEYPITGAVCFLAIALFAYLAAGGYLASSATSPQQQNKTGRLQQVIQDENRPPSPIPVTLEGVVRVSSELGPDEQAARATQNTQGWIQIFIQLGTLAAAGLAARFAYGAYCANTREAKASEDAVNQMRHEWNEQRKPRFYISGVAVYEFVPGGRPVFSISLSNPSPTVLEIGVAMRVQRRNAGYGHMGGKWSREQILTIPAETTRLYFVDWGLTLTQGEIDAFNYGRDKLILSGRLPCG